MHVQWFILTRHGIDKTKNERFHSYHQGFFTLFPFSIMSTHFFNNPSIITSLCPEWIRYHQHDSYLSLFRLLQVHILSLIHRYTQSLTLHDLSHSILSTHFITTHITQIMDIVTDPVCRNRVPSFSSHHTGMSTTLFDSTL